MTRCSEYRPMLLDYRYGLLDAEEAGAVRAHLSGCKACSTAWAEAGRQQQLLARAAKGVGPVLSFTAPAAPVTPATPARTANTAWASYLGWAAVAAGFFLAVAVLGVPAARDVAAHSRAKSAVERELANLTKARSEAIATRTAAESEYKAARKNHDELVAAWAEADRTRPAVTVSGPVVPVSGAPNEYQVSVGGRTDGFEAAVKDDTGRVIHSQSVPAGSTALRLPPEASTGIKPGSDLSLHVSANGATADPVRLTGPAYVTHLTTDKPVYRPGEAVYFRSLTLDRARFLPPTKDIALRYELRSPDGKVVPGCELAGMARPAVQRDGEASHVEGPDGQPIRGVGTGAFALPTEIVGGEYTLVVSESTPAGAKLLATRRIVVRKPGASPIPPPVNEVARPTVLEFFPEGGHLVAGVPNRVYVRATTIDGRPTPAAGVITNDDEEVGRFATGTSGVGLGEFTFTPEPGRIYTANLNEPTKTYRLPDVKGEGVILHVADGVTESHEPIRLTLTSAGAERSLWVGAYVRGLPVAHAKTVAEPGRPVEVTLQPTDTTLGGVTRITVFEEVADGPDKPVAERLMFRRPARQLKLGVTADHTDGTVRLNVTAATEADAPTPAVLWAAVVRHDVAMAGGLAQGSLPAHLYLAGEVRTPDELEHAEFLLGDHPDAEKALDLVLGTQGWRRFAEQTQAGAATFGTRHVAFTEYWPKYEAAHARLTEARHRVTNTPTDSTATARTALSAAVGEWEAVTGVGRQLWRTAAAVGLFLVAAVLVYGSGVRGPTFGAACGCLVLSVGVMFSVVLTSPTRGNLTQAIQAANEPEPAQPSVLLPSAEITVPPKANESVAKVDTNQTMLPHASGNTSGRVRSMTLPEMTGPAPATRIRNEPLGGGTAFRWTPEFAELAKSPSSAEFCQRVMELADANVPRLPPLVVREYAHSRSGNGTLDHVETLLWQPVLVVPGSGTASVTFALGNAEVPYHVVVSGHTLDGRIGTVTTKIEVRK